MGGKNIFYNKNLIILSDFFFVVRLDFSGIGLCVL
jgi:hypothetical protein